MPDRVPKFTPSTPGAALRQGELISNIVQATQTLATIGGDAATLTEIRHPLAIVLTQDCDLENDFAARGGADAKPPPLPNILFCEVTTADALKGALPPGKDIWKRITQNKDERYHCLELVPPDQDATAEGLAASGIDFKRYFTVPAAEVYRRIELGEAVRRCRLTSPYAEHLSSRFAFFQLRVALPENHDVGI